MDECAERIRQTEAQMEQIKAARFGYVDNSLRQTEETISREEFTAAVRPHFIDEE